MAEEGAVVSMRLVVSFDDGPELTVTVQPRDLMQLERMDREAFDATGAIRPHHIQTIAWLALSRLKRTKNLDDTVPLPDTLDEFFDIADVTAEDEPAGNPTAADPPTG